MTSSPTATAPPQTPQTPLTLEDWRRAWPTERDDDATLAAMRRALGQYRRAQRVPRWRRRPAWVHFAPWFGATAASLGLALLVFVAQAPAPQAAETLASEVFVPVVPPERWASFLHDGTGTAWVVRTEIPSERLALLGLPYDPSQADRPQRAELLMHANGDVLAVRLIP